MAVVLNQKWGMNLAPTTYRTALQVEFDILVVDTLCVASPKHSRLIEEDDPMGL
jgi:hypothetical protein